jgi:CO/xanthine dehydrogenase Mo-binding subunit
VRYDRILEDLLNRDDFLVVGRSVVRTDALDKVLGRAKFTADYVPRDTAVVKVVRSPHPHALIKGIDASPALELPGVHIVLTAADVPGENQIGYALPDQPFLNDVKTRFVGDPVALVVAADEGLAFEGADAVRVKYSPLSPVLDTTDALMDGAPLVQEGGNVALTTKIRKGDIEKGFSEAKVVVEDLYDTPYQDHMYMEPEAAYAIPEGSGKITVIGGMQSPFLVREKVAHVLGWDLNQVRIIQALTGGAFGGKDDMGPLTCAKAALAAVKTGKPASLIFDRDESVAYSNKRFPARIRYKSGADKEGKITAIDVDITLECGAFANRAPFWLWRQTAHAAGPYEVHNASVDGRAVYTNKVFGGSYRGFGDVALHFAAESQVDRLAGELGMDPVELRLRNILKPGSKTTCDQLLDHSVGIEECLTKVAEASKWSRRKKKRNGSKVTGFGVGCAYHGISTSRSTPDWSAASLILNQDGSMTYRTGICELGQGAPIGHAKIVAEITGAPMDSIRIELPDTDSTPNAKPTHGSRGLMLGGTAAADAAIKLRERMVPVAADMLDCPEGGVDLRDGKASSKGGPGEAIGFPELAEEIYTRGISPASYGFYTSPKRYFDPETGLGVNYSVYTFAASVVEVEVDTETGLCEVVKVWPAMDVGKAIDPLVIEGQIHGAVSQGIGFTIMEHLKLKDGVVLTPGFKDYVVPSALDTPEYAPTIMVEEPYQHSAFGAKGVGEPAIISIVPAITNAIHDAVGVRLNKLPVTAEVLHSVMRRCAK